MQRLEEPEEAVMWWHKAASQGDVTAQLALGAASLNGVGVAQSKKEAISWWSKASAQGSVVAQSYIFHVKLIEKVISNFYFG